MVNGIIKYPTMTINHANQANAKRLKINPLWTLTCFARPDMVNERGPLFVVRELDVKIIRNKNVGRNKQQTMQTATSASGMPAMPQTPGMMQAPATMAGGAAPAGAPMPMMTQSTTGMGVQLNPNGSIANPMTANTSPSTTPFLTEQAIRASVRQAVLNMSLKLEAANKGEIQYLKHIGILGKRAPSCSLLDGDDMATLLEAFGRNYAASELRKAVNGVLRGDQTAYQPALLSEEEFTESLNEIPVMTEEMQGVDPTEVTFDPEVENGVLPAIKRHVVKKRKVLMRTLSDNNPNAPSVSTTQTSSSRSIYPNVPVAHTGGRKRAASDSMGGVKTDNNNGLDTLLSALSDPASPATASQVNAAAAEAQAAANQPQSPPPAQGVATSPGSSPTYQARPLGAFPGIAGMYTSGSPAATSTIPALSQNGSSSPSPTHQYVNSSNTGGQALPRYSLQPYQPSTNSTPFNRYNPSNSPTSSSVFNNNTISSSKLTGYGIPSTTRQSSNASLGSSQSTTANGPTNNLERSPLITSGQRSPQSNLSGGNTFDDEQITPKSRAQWESAQERQTTSVDSEPIAQF